MPANNRANGDKPSVDFSFDAFEKDATAKPFGVVIGGKRYEALNPLDLDYRAFAVAEADADEMFRLLFPDDYAEILENRISVAKLQAFSSAVLRHYGVDPTDASSAS